MAGLTIYMHICTHAHTRMIFTSIYDVQSLCWAQKLMSCGPHLGKLDLQPSQVDGRAEKGGGADLEASLQHMDVT